MAKVVIALHAHPADSAFSSIRSLLAFRYAQAALASGVQIRMVFCYQQAVRLGLLVETHPLAQQWRVFCQQQQIPLVVCHTMLEQALQAAQQDLAPGVQSSGLTAFAEALAEADQVVQF